jgi:hypothetical protein
MQCNLYFEVGILQADPSVPTVQASIRILQLHRSLDGW